MSRIEVIEWFRDGSRPASDTTVLIELDPASAYSEPVFVGYWDGERWLDIHNEPVDVIAWAHPPKGSRWIAQQLPPVRRGDHMPGGGAL